MPGRIGKVTANKKVPSRQLSPEMPSPVKPLQTKVYIDSDNENDIENQAPIEGSPISNELNPIAILLANGQPLLTNFEEKYLIDLILKTPNKDLSKLLEEKLQSILQMNYNLQSSLFTLNSSWIYDFLLKHFQTIMNHSNSSEFFDYILRKTVDKNNSTLAFKHWQLQTLVNNSQQFHQTKKRRMTVRHIDFK